MKGRKFTAAEKHFNEKLEKINREIKALKDENRQLRERNEELEKLCTVFASENTELQARNKILQEYSKMTDEDLRNAKQRDAALAHICSMAKLMQGFDTSGFEIKLT